LAASYEIAKSSIYRQLIAARRLSVGQLTGRRGEFYDQEDYKGRAILVRYIWSDISPQSARMEQSFSDDGGKSWEVNWICEL
jgi:hypothetical protein